LYASKRSQDHQREPRLEFLKVIEKFLGAIVRWPGLTANDVRDLLFEKDFWWRYAQFANIPLIEVVGGNSLDQF